MLFMSARRISILVSFAFAAAFLLLMLRLLGGVAADSLEIEQSSTSGNTPPATAQGAVDVIIYLDRSADLVAMTRISDIQIRRLALVESLQAVATDAQVPLLKELDKLSKEKMASHIRPFWIVNAVAATVAPDVIPTLAQFPGVDRVELDRQHQAIDRPPDEDTKAEEVPFKFAGLASLPAVQANEAANWSIAAIGAPYVWNLLNIDGDNVTVAIVDTGVDWQHPALRDNYRGGRGASAEHIGNWYSTVNPTQTVPVDPHGHGTHVAGTAVGQKGIGVAPGANWIAVAIADEHGRIGDSDVHAAFEWLLAPNDDPSLAPDIVNNSWGTTGTYTAFVEDVAVLEAAGIVTVFAAGNTGPGATTINAPASYPGALGVAAEDDTGAITWFSSRGPSPLTSEAKPLLSAPGAQVLSAYPDNRYAIMNGTSMATPHVSGAIALMLSAEPRLTPADIRERLAAATDNAIHDPARGWGSLNAYAVVSPLAAAGNIIGQVGSGNWPGTEAVVTLKTLDGRTIDMPVDAQGHFNVRAVPGHYRIRASAFGFKPVQFADIEIYPGHVTRWDVDLEPRPGGTISIGLARDESGELLQGDLQVATGKVPLPVHPIPDSDGRYTLSLPAGEYRLEARVPGFRLAVRDVTVGSGDAQRIDVTLESGPRLLLVDSGSWQYRSVATFFADALEDNGYFADYLPIRNPYDDVPDVAELTNYDAVLWSAPYDSPGYLGANDVITDYLGLGGRLLISGQNVANYDGADGVSTIWWSRLLEARWLADFLPNTTLSGVYDTPFAGSAYSLNGLESAANQISPDQVSPLLNSLTRPVIRYPDGSAAGLLSNRCEPFRLLYLGFGLEGVTGRAERAQMMAAVLETLIGPEEQHTAIWQSSPASDFVVGGEQPAYTATLRNLSRTLTQTFQLEAIGGDWPRSILTPTLTLAPCAAGQTVLSLDVPAELPRDTRHVIHWTAVPAGGEPTVLTISHKSPGNILLVDDDRFVHTEEVYEATLNRLGIAYDLWETGWPTSVRGSPPSRLLHAYDLIIWFTGYDWFEPLTGKEVMMLTEYLEGGGRLFLSSQDVLYYHHTTSLARDFFGVAAYQESITPTIGLFDEHSGAPAELKRGLPLQYGAYQNFSDGIAPAEDTVPYLWHNQGALAGTALSGTGATGASWRTVFWALPFESLPVEQQVAAMATVFGQLSDIGDTTFTVDRRVGQADEPRVYSLNIANSGPQQRQVWMSNTLPISLTYRHGSVGIAYEPSSRTLTWSGVMPAGERRVLTYTADINPANADGRRIDNTVVLRYAPLSTDTAADPFMQLPITQSVTTWLDTPDLSASQLDATGAIAGVTGFGREKPAPYHLITYTLTLQNNSAVATEPMTATVAMPQELGAIESSIMSTQGEARLEAWRLIWSGVLQPGEIVATSIALTQTVGLNDLYPAVAYLEDGVTDPVIKPIFFTPPLYRLYVPILGNLP